MSLSGYTVAELWTELMERERRRELLQCDECEHFRPYAGQDELPDDWQSCGLGRAQKFRQPKTGFDDPSTWGIYRSRCPDMRAKKKD